MKNILKDAENFLSNHIKNYTEGEKKAFIQGIHFTEPYIVQFKLETKRLWNDGFPPKPFCGEWFIAETTYGDKVVLTALPEEYTYDFRTADETYIMKDKIKRWMQFPTSAFIDFSNDKAAT